MKVNSQKLRDRIIKICEADPRCASDDKLLMAKVWYLEGWHDDQLYEKLQKMPAAESITRARRKLIEEGEIEADEKVQQARKNEEEKVRKELGYN